MLLAVGGKNGRGDDNAYSANDTAEIFNLQMGSSCRIKDLPGDFIDGELMWLDEVLLYCGGEPQISNASTCFRWSEVEQMFQPVNIELSRPNEDMDSVFVPKVGWWILNAIDNSNDPRTEIISVLDRSHVYDVSRCRVKISSD